MAADLNQRLALAEEESRRLKAGAGGGVAEGVWRCGVRKAGGADLGLSNGSAVFKQGVGKILPERCVPAEEWHHLFIRLVDESVVDIWKHQMSGEWCCLEPSGVVNHVAREMWGLLEVSLLNIPFALG